MKIAATATNDPSMVEAKVALEKFCAGYQSVAVYYERLDAKDTQWKAGLPKWCAVRLQKIFRQVMSGVRDNLLGNFLNHPPRKGWECITWKEHLKNASSWGDELEELEREFAAWKSPPKELAEKIAGGQSPAETKEDPSLPPDKASPVTQLIAELGAMAKEQREHWVANVPEPSTVFAKVAMLRDPKSCRQSLRTEHSTALCMYTQFLKHGVRLGWSLVGIVFQ